MADRYQSRRKVASHEGERNGAAASILSNGSWKRFAISRATPMRREAFTEMCRVAESGVPRLFFSTESCGCPQRNVAIGFWRKDPGIRMRELGRRCGPVKFPAAGQRACRANRQETGAPVDENQPGAQPANITTWGAHAIRVALAGCLAWQKDSPFRFTGSSPGQRVFESVLAMTRLQSNGYSMIMSGT